MLDFGLVAPFNLLNLHKIRNAQKINKSLVMEFLLLNLSVSKYKTYAKNVEMLYMKVIKCYHSYCSITLLSLIILTLQLI